ncbi:MAG TPA: ribosomal protein S18-alanine N-acetyltransferase [Terriglobales bacterium]|nr:ribosomal protein S18-alanine N-acetyltransferase [Terriglobales bacterium]
MLIRAANPADLPPMQELAAESPQAAHWSASEWKQIFDFKVPRAALICEENQAALGFLIARTLGDDWELENIVVAQQARRRGAARRLMQELIDLSRAQRAAIHLDVRESNRAARALYQSCGFNETGRRKAYYSQPNEDAVLYRFSFSSPEK